jgi:hypothetical protein
MICVHARTSELEKTGASALSKLVIAQMNRIEHLEVQLARMRRTQFGRQYRAISRSRQNDRPDAGLSSHQKSGS